MELKTKSPGNLKAHIFETVYLVNRNLPIGKDFKEV